MTFEIALSSGFIIALITAVYGYGRLNRSVEDTEKDIEENKQTQLNENAKIWAEIQKCRVWETGHDRDTGEKRSEYDRELSRLRENMGIKDGKLDAILAMVTDIKKNMEDQMKEMNKRIERIEERRN